MATLSRRRFLRLPIAALSALLPAAVQAQGYPMPPEPPAQAITIDSLNKDVLFLKQDNLWRDITVKWLEFNVNAMLKCYRGCGGMIPKQKYRI